MQQVPRAPRARIVRPGEPDFEPKPVQLTCPLCGEDLGAIVLMDPKMRFVGLEVECWNVEDDGRTGHGFLFVKTMDLVRAEEEAARRTAAAAAEVEQPAAKN